MPFKNQKYFTTSLLEWYNPKDRPTPWKGEKNPYFIWLSEIILQQTRVEQGLKYFIKFKKNYPTVKDLANAPEDELMKNWEGLGYYSRARNLQIAAKFIDQELEGQFPKTYEEIITLKGVGTYTAAAISSFAYGLPYAVVDGNVYRVLCRFFGIDTPTDSTEGKKLIQQLAQKLLFKKDPGTYNQAIMDFGATVCKPKGVICDLCPLQTKCIAFKKGIVNDLPIKKKKIKKKKRYFNYLVIQKENEVFLKKRSKKDIWKNLYEFPVIETVTEKEWKELSKEKELIEIFSDQFYGISKHSASYRQELSHRTIIARFHEIKVNDNFKGTNKGWLCVNKKEIRKYAFPKIIDSYLSKEG